MSINESVEDAELKRKDAALKRKGFWISFAGFVVAAGGLLVSWHWASVSSKSVEESEIDRELQWRPALSLVLRTGVLQDREPLGLFLENAGKGPALLDSVCEAFPLSGIDIPDLRTVVTKPRPGTMLAAGEVIPLLAFAPDSGKVWTRALSGTVNQLVAQMEAKNFQMSICYRSLYRGCYRVRRVMASNKWIEQSSEHTCDAPCCEANEKPAN